MDTAPRKRDTNYRDREAAMAMEAHGVITGRQTHGVEADVDMRGERLLNFDPYFATPHRNLEQVSRGNLSRS